MQSQRSRFFLLDVGRNSDFSFAGARRAEACLFGRSRRFPSFVLAPTCTEPAVWLAPGLGKVC